MAKLVDQAMIEGAVGWSSGVEYEVASYSHTNGLIAVAGAVTKHGGLYMTHVRDEADKVFGRGISIGERTQFQCSTLTSSLQAPIDVAAGGLVMTGAIFNMPAAAVTVVCTALLLAGVSARGPGYPWVPMSGIVVCVALMIICLPCDTWIRLAVWLLLGIALYASHGLKRSALRAPAGGAIHDSESRADGGAIATASRLTRSCLRLWPKKMPRLARTTGINRSSNRAYPS